MNKAAPLLMMVLAGAAVTANALESDAAGLPEFTMVDTDGDALVSRTEAKASRLLVARFDMLDMNRDGRLDEQEYRDAYEALTP